MSTNTNTLSVSSTGMVISKRRATNSIAIASSPRCGVADHRGPDAAEHLLGEPEVLIRQSGGALRVAVHDRSDQRRVLFECPAAQGGRVRLGEETERHLGAQLGRQLEE